MSETNEILRRELLEMRDGDSRVREELAATKELFEGYCPKMETVHLKNAARLKEIIEKNGFPGKSLVGEDGAEAAWIIVMHAISLPDFQRKILPVMKNAAKNGEVPLSFPAYLEDRIAFFENRPQRYGTQSDWNESGEMEVWTLENEEKVNDYRAEAGLKPLESKINDSKEFRENAPKDWQKRQLDSNEWARKVGWRI